MIYPFDVKKSVDDSPLYSVYLGDTEIISPRSKIHAIWEMSSFLMDAEFAFEQLKEL